MCCVYLSYSTVYMCGCGHENGSTMSVDKSLKRSPGEIRHSKETLPDAVVWRQNLYCRIYQLTKSENGTPEVS